MEGGYNLAVRTDRVPGGTCVWSKNGKGPPMRRITDWLDQLGMSEYTQRFAENGISLAALRHLTDRDLKDIGEIGRASCRERV